MQPNEETLNTWNNIANIYEEKFMNLPLYNDTYDKLCTADIKQAAKVLEIACGPGNISRYLLSKRPDFQLSGIDSSANMIEIAKKNNPQAKFTVMDARDIGRLKERFDIIVCGFCLPYLSDAECSQLISASTRLLSEDGLIYLSFVAGDPAQSTYKISAGGRVYFHYHALSAIGHLLTRNGFTDIQKTIIEYPLNEDKFEEHTILIGSKLKKM